MTGIPSQIIQQAVREAREHGVELTPAEVEQDAKDAYTALRAYLKDKGADPPESDEEMTQMISWLIHEKGVDPMKLVACAQRGDEIRGVSPVSKRLRSKLDDLLDGP